MGARTGAGTYLANCHGSISCGFERGGHRGLVRWQSPDGVGDKHALLAAGADGQATRHHGGPGGRAEVESGVPGLEDEALARELRDVGREDRAVVARVAVAALRHRDLDLVDPHIVLRWQAAVSS